MAELKCYLMPNKFHKKGDKQPSLKTRNDRIVINEPGEYEVAIWPPKEGKQAFFMMLKKVTNEEQSNQSNEQKPEINQPPVKQPEKEVSNPKTLFKRR